MMFVWDAADGQLFVKAGDVEAYFQDADQPGAHGHVLLRSGSRVDVRRTPVNLAMAFVALHAFHEATALLPELAPADQKLVATLLTVYGKFLLTVKELDDLAVFAGSAS